MSQFLNLLVAGLTSGAIYGIFGACLAVWFRVCNVLNLAVGDFAMFGAIGTAWLVQNAGLPFIAGIVVALAGVGLTAWLFDWVVLHPAAVRSRTAMVMRYMKSDSCLGVGGVVRLISRRPDKARLGQSGGGPGQR